MAVRQKDVAKYAGVSPATVSRVLNNTTGVDEQLVQKVYSAMEDLGYAPPRKSMREETDMIAVLGWKGFLTDIYYSGIYNGILKFANSQNFGLVISDWTEENKNYRERILQDGGAEGIIAIIPSQEEEHIIREVAEIRDIPCCIVDRYPMEAKQNYVTAAHEETAILAVEHLIRLGHTRIAHITTGVDTQIGRSRIRGYQTAMKNAGIRLRADYLIQASPISDQWYTEEQGAEGMQRLLALKEPPTAVFAVNDRVAFGALSVLQELGIDVPREMAVVGIDDHPSAQVAYGGLTTIDTQKGRVGELAAQLVVESIQAEHPARFQVEIPPRLIIRKTCGG